jgi:type IV secretory pathway VirB10-like protein
MATESEHLAPATTAPKVPLRRSTVIAIALGFAALAVVAAFLVQGNPTTPPQTVAQVAPESTTTGKPAQIDDEAAGAKGAAGRPTTTASAPPVPVPPDVQRPDNSAAFGERINEKLTGRPTATPHRSTTADAEAEAQVRLAKAVVFDMEEPTTSGRMGEAARPATSAAGTPAPGVTVTAPSEALAQSQEKALRALMASAGQQGQAPGRDWLQEYAGATKERQRSVLRPTESAGREVLHQGKVIPAVLARGLNSDLPGVVVATTAVDVFDSLGHGIKLIPKGSSAVGRYSADIRDGQQRVLIAFERLILPDGRSFDLPAAPGSDLNGRGGVPGDVNNHYLRRFGASLLIAIVADRTQKPATGTFVNSSGPQDAAGQVMVDVSRSVLERSARIQPTITVAAGTRINIEVTNDMLFTPREGPPQ